MPSFGFWNIDSLRETEAGNRTVPRAVADLARERVLDLLFLIECAIPSTHLLTAFSPEDGYFSIPCSDRFKVLAKFDPRYMSRCELPVPNGRFDIWHLTLPLQDDALILALHGPDKRNNSSDSQQLFFAQVASDLAYIESKVGHDRSILLGDFNANPFEAPVGSMLGMNAVISRDIAREEPRQKYSKSYPYLYNPMWTLFGGRHSEAAPATYFYRGGNPHEHYWHMLDQVLLRGSLISRFDLEALDIVTNIGGQSLYNRANTPDRIRFSDHLPVVFDIDLKSDIN